MRFSEWMDDVADEVKNEIGMKLSDLCTTVSPPWQQWYNEGTAAAVAAAAAVNMWTDSCDEAAAVDSR